MSKKILDIKIIHPRLISLNNYGNEDYQSILSSLDKYDNIYDKLDCDKKITNDDLTRALTVILKKFKQDNIKRIGVDLDIFETDMIRAKNNDVDNILQEHTIMKKFIIDNNLWEKLINSDEFLEYLRKDYNGK